MKKRYAFTLAEILVTLGIIGVVSVMTIPPLTQNIQKRTFSTQLHNVYNEFQQALVQELNGTSAVNLIETSTFESDDSVKNFIRNSFKVVKDCGASASGCFADKYFNLSGSSVNPPQGASVCMSLSNSASVCITRAVDVAKQQVGSMTVDTNGLKAPNIIGRDAFSMTIYSDGTLDIQDLRSEQNINTPPQQLRELGRRNCFSSSWSEDCFGILLNDDWEMRY